jgi:hypothetical protein
MDEMLAGEIITGGMAIGEVTRRAGIRTAVTVCAWKIARWPGIKHETIQVSAQSGVSLRG